ncbi:MAG: rhamnulokinase [Verrucomicrobiota bacterium]
MMKLGWVHCRSRSFCELFYFHLGRNTSLPLQPNTRGKAKIPLYIVRRRLLTRRPEAASITSQNSVKEQCYLGVDLGAESGRVMAGVWNGKRIRLEELHRFPNGPVELGGTLRWDVLRLWSEIQEGLGIAARSRGKEVKSVGVDTWGVDFVLLSKSNELLGQPYNYRDARTKGIMQKAFARVPREEIFAATGLQFLGINTLYQLLAMKRSDPELLAAADCFLMMPDFFHWCLSGARVAEFTNATTTQFFHPTKRAWSYDLLKRFGLPTRIMPKVVTPGTRIGSLRESVSKITGLGAIDVIAPATHDTGCAVAAIPARGGEGTWAYISSGTWSLMGLELHKAQLSERVLDFNLTNEGGVDGTYRLLKNITGLWLVQQCKRAFERKGKKVEYAELVGLAKAAPALRSLVEPDDARFMNPADMPSAIREFCRETSQPVPNSHGAFIRCALESLALKYQTVLKCLEEVSGQRVEVIHIVGGGSRNALLNQFTADACNRPVLAGPVEATVLGNVLIQARGHGEIGSLAELRAVVRDSCGLKCFEPKPAQVQAWQEARGWFADRLKTSRRAGA